MMFVIAVICGKSTLLQMVGNLLNVQAAIVAKIGMIYRGSQ